MFSHLALMSLRQQGAQLFDDGVQLVLVAQPPAAEKLLIDPHGCADEPQLLGAHPGADLQVPTPDEERTGRREVCRPQHELLWHEEAGA